MKPKLSLIVPVYNRPQEVDELLASLTQQSVGDFELIIVEDGSAEKCEEVVKKYQSRLELSYYFKTNSGPGLSRNYGAQRANSDFFIFLDSDCIIPPGYVEAVLKGLENDSVDTFGGPDRAMPSFSVIQKAINYSMTSFLTTGGIRGGKASMEKFHPRSFNMGMSREVFEKTKGFSEMRFGEDIDLSIRIVKGGFNSKLFPEAYVYHKRRTNFRQFFKQVFNSGIARINLYKRHPHTLKAVHFFPALFTLGLCFGILLAAVGMPQIIWLYAIYFFAILIRSAVENKSLVVGGTSVISSLIQLSAYGFGFLLGIWRRIILGKDEFNRFTRNFYK